MKPLNKNVLRRLLNYLQITRTREHLKSQILETLRTVSTDNETEDLQQIVTNLLLDMITKSSTKFENVSIIKKNHSRNTTVS